MLSIFGNPTIDDSNANSLAIELQNWAIGEKIGHHSMSKLLKVLRNHNHPELPKDGRTLMKTPKHSSKLIKEVYPGKYVSFPMHLLCYFLKMTV